MALYKHHKCVSS